MFKQAFFISTFLLSIITTSSAWASTATQSGAADDVTIKVKASTYGNTGHFCSATGAVGMICNGEEDCQVSVNDMLCGDPNPGVLKHLTTTYDCGVHSYYDDTPEAGIATFDCDNPSAFGARQLN